MPLVALHQRSDVECSGWHLMLFLAGGALYCLVVVQVFPVEGSSEADLSLFEIPLWLYGQPSLNGLAWGSVWKVRRC